MSRYVRILIAVLVLSIYLAALRYIAPPDQPYFILGIGMVALVAWLLGSIQALVTALLLIPATNWIYSHFTISASYTHFASSPGYLGLQVFIAVLIGHLRREAKKYKRKEAELSDVNQDMQAALSRVQELGGLHNMCGDCKKIQDDEGEWQSIDAYLKEQTKMELSHCICPDCASAFQSAVENMKS